MGSMGFEHIQSWRTYNSGSADRIMEGAVRERERERERE